MGSLTFLDIVVILAVGGGALLGLMRGFVFEVLSLFAWVAVTIALKLFYAPVTTLVSQHIRTHAGAGLLAFALIGAVVFFGGRLVAERIGRRTRSSILGPADRVLGLGFGAIKGLIGVTLLFMVGNLFYDLGFGGTSPRPDWVREARTYPLLQASRRTLDDLVARRRGPQAGEDADNAVDNSTEASRPPI